jgi:hypothetical protein
MEKLYSRNELENKKLTELKIIAKNLQLSISGKKADIIDNILITQPVPQKQPNPQTPTYFDLLPKDIKNIVEKYQIENDSNRKLLEYLLYGTYTALKLLNASESNKRRKQLGKVFEKYDMDIYIVVRKETAEPKNTLADDMSYFVFYWGNVGIISDQVIRDIFPIFYKESGRIGAKLIEFESKFRWIETVKPREQGQQKYLYELVEIKQSLELIEDQ